MMKHRIAALLLAGTCLGSGSALAQSQRPSAPVADQANSVDDIVVTARRREERLQDVPLAVTALSGEGLAAQNIVSVGDLGTKVPSLTVTPGLGSSRAVPTFAIRGLSQQELTIVADPSVSVYLGDIVAARPQGLNSALYDIRSVEVLKGPQGTLFGRNVTGGAVIIRPNTPTDVFEGAATVTVGNFGVVNTEGFINAPLSDKAQLRIAFSTQNGDGWFRDNVLDRNINDVSRRSGRISLALQPTEALSSLFVLDHFYENDGGTGGLVTNINAAAPFNSAAARAPRNYPTLDQMLADQRALGIYATNSGVPMYNHVETTTFSNNTKLDVNAALSIRNIFGYRKVEDDILEDTDGLPIPLLNLEKHDDIEQVTNELQVFGDVGDLNYIVGLYYFNETGTNHGVSVQGAVDPGPLEPTTLYSYPGWADTYADGDNTSYALYAQGTYSLDRWVSGLALTAGARANRDIRGVTFRSRTATACRYTRDLDNNPATPETVVPLSQCDLGAETTFEEPTYNVSLDWRFSEGKMVYAATRHGYRTGGYGLRAASEAALRRTFRPELVDDIEIGFKADWRFNGMFLRTNLAAYSSDFTDIQRLLTDPTTTPVSTVTTNAGKAKIEGFEFETLFRPTDWFELSGFWSNTDADFVEFIAPNGADLSNNPVARAPKNIWSATARVELPLDSNLGSASISATYFHTDEFSGNDDYTVTQVVPAYELLNLNAEWRNVAGTALDLGVYVNNALEEEYLLPYLEILPLGFSAKTPGEPRTFGIKATVRFGQ